MKEQYMGLVKLGQLKRIQHILYWHNCYPEKEELKDELAYILKGRGHYYPIWIDIDFSYEECIKNEQDLIQLQRLKEINLKKIVAEVNHHKLSNPK